MEANVARIRIFRIILTAVIVIIFLMIIITGSNIFFFWSIFNWLQHTIGQISGADGWLAKGLAALLMAGLVALPLGRLIRSFIPIIPQKNKTLYRSVTFGVIALCCLLIFFVSKNTFFDPETGKPVKYYSEKPEGGYNFYSSPGFNPVTGDTLKPVTKEIILKSKGIYPKPPAPIKQAQSEVYKPPPQQPTSYSNSEVVQKLSETTPAKEKPIKSTAPGQRIELEPLTSSHEVPSAKTTVPTARTQPQPNIYVKSPPVDTRCKVTFNNSCSHGFAILNANREQVLTLDSHTKMTLRMSPGVYYLKNSKIGEDREVNVPQNTAVYILDILPKTKVVTNYYYVRQPPPQRHPPVRVRR